MALRVLVAEADDAERTRLTTLLDTLASDLDQELTVDTAGDGTTALAMCSDHAYDLVLAEVVLDGLSGLALVRALQGGRDPAPPVVLVTTMSRETDRYWGLRNGAVAYFSKPYEDGALRQRLARVLDGERPLKADRPIKI